MAPARKTPVKTAGKAQASWMGHARLRLRHLRLAQAIDRFRNLQKAAESLYLSQPAASRLLAEMESLMGTALFERRARGLEPNIYGEAFLRRVRSVLGELQQAGDEIAALRAGQSGQVAFGAIVVAGLGPVAQALGAVTQHHPDITVRIEIGTSDQLLKQLADGALDFALARLPQRGTRQFDFEALTVEELCIICPATHPLARSRRKPRLADLENERWVLQFEGTPLRQAFDQCFLAEGRRPPEKIIECASHEVAAALVAETEGLSILARPIADIYAGSGRFALLPVHKKIAMEPYGIVRRRGGTLSPAAENVLSAIRENLPR